MSTNTEPTTPDEPPNENYADAHPLGGGLVLLHPTNDREWIWATAEILCDLEVCR